MDREQRDNLARRLGGSLQAGHAFLVTAALFCLEVMSAVTGDA